MLRYLSKVLQEDLKEKMVFLGGPRQVGKTTLALQILGAQDSQHPAYFNWDTQKGRKEILQGILPYDESLIVFDEIHKYLRWRNLVKGLYDQFKDKKKFLVTGSARLDYYRKGGDSLQGRYHYHRLHPFSLYEINSRATQEDLSGLLQFGGFPEPFLKGNNRHWKRWQNERAARVIQEDLISLEKVKEISQLEVLQNLLPSKVGSILSINSIREDLDVKFETAERWITIFDNLYYSFRLSPYTLKGKRTAKKEKKLYLWDWSLVESSGSRFENLVASNLLKYCHYHFDVEGDKYELRFLRDSEKREVDFIVLDGSRPLFGVECKTGEKQISPHLKYFSSRTSIPYFYQVHLGEADYEIPEYRTRILPFRKFVTILKI